MDYKITHCLIYYNAVWVGGAVAELYKALPQSGEKPNKKQIKISGLPSGPGTIKKIKCIEGKYQ